MELTYPSQRPQNPSLSPYFLLVKLIKSTIHQTKTCYVNDPTVSPALLWEMIKLKVRESSLSYSAMKKKKVNRIQEEIEKEIAKLETELSSAGKKVFEILSITEALEKLVEHRTKGAILRSKIVWYNEEEKNTK